MHRMLSLSVAAGLALSAGGVASAQSRTVSTADMPKPGVSYISGPSTPERRETVSTGTLPQPARLYVNGQVSTGSYEGQGGGNGSYVDQTASYGGGYYSGGYGNYPNNGNYPGNDSNNGYGRGHDHDHGGYPGNGGYPGGGNGGHGGNGYQPPGNSVSVGQKPNPPNGKPTVKAAPPPRQDRNNYYNGNDGWNQTPQPIPVNTGVNANRGSQPGTGMGTGNQPGTGVPLRSGNGNGYGRGR